MKSVKNDKYKRGLKVKNKSTQSIRNEKHCCNKCFELKQTLLEMDKKDEREIFLYLKLNIFDYFAYVNRFDDVMKHYCEYKKKSKKTNVNNCCIRRTPTIR